MISGISSALIQPFQGHTVGSSVDIQGIGYVVQYSIHQPSYRWNNNIWNIHLLTYRVYVLYSGNQAVTIKINHHPPPYQTANATILPHMHFSETTCCVREQSAHKSLLLEDLAMTYRAFIFTPILILLISAVGVMCVLTSYHNHAAITSYQKGTGRAKLSHLCSKLASTGKLIILTGMLVQNIHSIFLTIHMHPMHAQGTYYIYAYMQSDATTTISSRPQQQCSTTGNIVIMYCTSVRS